MQTKKETTTTAPARALRPEQQLQPKKTCTCGACEPPRPKLQNGVRRNTVSYLCPSGGGGAVPFIRLSGHWLEKAGFDIGDSILVATEHRKLTITFEKED